MSERQPSRPALVLRVPSRTEFLAAIRDTTRLLAELAGFERPLAEQVALAVDEAATNVIRHAYHGASDRAIELRFEHSAEELRIEIADDGEPVQPGTVPDLDLQRYASERKRGGFGMHLMGRIMDSVTFRRVSGHNVCCMVKRRPMAETGETL